MLAACGLLALVCATTGCSRRGASTLAPRDVLSLYAKAVRAGRYDKAYGLMSAAFRKRHGKPDFVKLLRSNPVEVKRALARAQGAADKVEIQAVFALGGGEKLKMVAEKGRWRLAGDPIDFYSQRTPRDALRSFLRAIKGRRYRIILRFMPSKWADAMTVDKLKALWEGEKRAEVETMLKELGDNLQAPITVTGAKAHMPYGAAKAIRFVLEDGVWKILDPD